ncbi:hypothetical protein [Tunturiibacter lichenicola]|uniref:hypothetical protein n=1 Tax=Tunturiibacter lichenicola TaxID=2051959 RepID=UPI0021B34295|nr:hypothetical protein [Edaphobacter lichenicola]
MLNRREDLHEAVAKGTPMHGSASNYLAVETAMSGLCNGVLNLAAAFALFHGRDSVPATGPGSLLMDSIGETFLVTALSMSVPTLIARHRRRTGTLPTYVDRQTVASGNPYIRAIVMALLFTCFLVLCNAFILPRVFPNRVSFRNVLLFKTVYGAVLGSIATLLALYRALSEEPPMRPSRG